MKTKRVVLFMLITTFCLGASFNPVGCQTDVTGRITDSVSGESVVGAVVSVKNHYEIIPSTTDVNGDYTLSDLTYGEYTLVITYDGYNNLEEDVNPTYFNNGISCQAIDGDFQLVESTSTQINLEGLVALWHMDETSWDGTADEVLDVSGNNNHGQAVSLSGSLLAGKFGNCSLDMDGTNDWVTIPYSTSLRITEELTVMCWAKLDAASDLSSMVSTYGSPVAKDGWFLTALNDGDDKMRFSVKGAVDDTFFGTYVEVASDLDDGAWHHFAGVYSKAGEYLRIYCDGAKVGADVDNEGQTIRFGGATGGTGIGSYYGYAPGVNAWDGYIDDVAIFNRALTTTEISTIYSSGEPIE